MRSDPAPGSTIAGRYVVGELLGRGGMGEVRAGRDVRLGREVAIKLLSPDLAALPQARARFEREAQAAARLSHPNVVLVYDSGEHEGVPFLVMERLPGRTLADDLARGPLPVERVRSVAVGILAGLASAHRAGIVHRDIKPANVLLDSDGNVKLGDFGIAKTIEGVDVTTTGMLLGTPAYLSPEQVAGAAATPRSDIFSVGVLLYESLTGTKPFVAESPLALAQAIHSRQPAPVAVLRPDTPPPLTLAVTKAMEKNPQRRFATADEMATALAPASMAADRGEVAATEPLPSTQAFGANMQRAAWSTSERPTVPGGRRRDRATGWRILAAVAVMLVVAVVVAVAVGSRDDAPNETSGVSVTTVPATAAAASVPPELAGALQRLEEAVRP